MMLVLVLWLPREASLTSIAFIGHKSGKGEDGEDDGDHVQSHHGGKCHQGSVVLVQQTHGHRAKSSGQTAHSCQHTHHYALQSKKVTEEGMSERRKEGCGVVRFITCIYYFI